MNLCDFLGAAGTCTRCGFKSDNKSLRRMCGSPIARKAEIAKPQNPLFGAGAELKKLLAGWPFRIVATPNCSCNARAAEMDRQGIEWCEANIDTIVGWLREEARNRGLPFLDAAGRLLVRRAIANARKSAPETA